MQENLSICIKCGQKKRGEYFPLCRSCTPYFYDKGKFPHQVARQTVEWAIRRSERLNEVGNKCEWCGTKPEKGLTIHHRKGVDPRLYRRIWQKILENKAAELKKTEWKNKWDGLLQNDSIEKVKEEIIESDKKRALNAPRVKACPNCDSSQLSERKIQTPKYYCSNCQTEFDTPKMRLTKQYNKPEEQLAVLARRRGEKVFRNQVVAAFYDGLKEEYEKYVTRIVQEYLSMENIVVLCKKCHFNAEHGRVLCNKCKKNYHEINRDQCDVCEEQERKNRRKFNLDLLKDESEFNDIKSQLRTIQNHKCPKCKTKLYDLEFSVPLRTWKQECWKCNKQTEVVSYTIGDEMDNCVIGSHEEIDEILRDEYPQIEKLYSKTMRSWTTGNKCVHCGAFQGNGFIEHDLIWDRGVYNDDYDAIFPIERILSIGHILYLDGNGENKAMENMILVCFECFEREISGLNEK